LPAVTVEIEIGLPGGGHLRGAVARPDRQGPRPGVVVLHEVLGDQPEMRAVCDVFAERGYVALMPDLFSSRGPRALCLSRTLIEASIGKPERVTGYIDAARAWLAEQDDVDGDRIGVIGFCMGGGFALAYVAGGRPGVQVASVNYGEVPGEPQRLRGACPIVASYGRRDLFMRGRAERLRSNLERLGIEHDVKLYDDAGHSFMTQGNHPVGRLVFFPLRLGYVPHAADDAWQRVFAYFDARLQPDDQRSSTEP
jgi:carboxymethylenebutenolidase